MSEKYFLIDTENGLIPLSKIVAALADANLEVIAKDEVQKVLARMLAIEGKLEENLRFARDLEAKMDGLEARRMAVEKNRDAWKGVAESLEGAASELGIARLRIEELEKERDEAIKRGDKWIEAHAALTVRSALERELAKADDALITAAAMLLEIAVLPSGQTASTRDHWLKGYDERKQAKRRAENREKEGKNQ